MANEQNGTCKIFVTKNFSVEKNSNINFIQIESGLENI